MTDTDGAVVSGDGEAAVPAVEAATAAAPLNDNKVQKQLRALAARSELGVTEKLPLLFPSDDGGWEEIEDPDYYIVFNEPTNEAIDAMRDALEQYKENAQYMLDESSGAVVGEQEVTRQRRSWPVVEVLLEFRLIADAVLPEWDKGGNVKPRRWADQKAADRAFLQKGCTPLLGMLVHMGGDHILGREAERLMTALGE